MRIEAVQGDITAERVDAVVNAANEALAGGGGVDGAIHRAAGAEELHAACAALGRCPTGDAKATPGFRLAARWVIHAVGPRYRDGEPTAHIMSNGEVFFQYPPVPETVEATLTEVARCTREGIRINTFMLDATSYLKTFVERLTKLNRGRAFFTTPETLGDYVLVDFIEQKRALRGARRGA